MIIPVQGIERSRKRTITEWLIIINGIVFLIELFLYEYMILWFSLIPALLFQGAQLWRLITHMFLHAGILHIVLNMYALFIFGQDVEKVFGEKDYLILYFGSGLSGALLFSAMAVFVYNTPYVYALGASAAVFGVMAAFAFTFPDRKIYAWLGFIVIKMKAKHFALLYALFELFRAIFLGPYGGVAYAAHVGGFIFGVIFTRYMMKKLYRPSPYDYYAYYTYY